MLTTRESMSSVYVVRSAVPPRPPCQRYMRTSGHHPSVRQPPVPSSYHYSDRFEHSTSRKRWHCPLCPVVVRVATHGRHRNGPRLHHSRTGEAEVAVSGAAHDDVVEDTDADILQGLHDLVSGIDVLLGRVRLSCGVRCSPARTDSHWTSEPERRHRSDSFVDGMQRNQTPPSVTSA